jgi:hypothetical protein
VQTAEHPKLQELRLQRNGLLVLWDSGHSRLFSFQWLFRNRPETILKCGQLTTSPITDLPPLPYITSICDEASSVLFDWGHSLPKSRFPSRWLFKFAQLDATGKQASSCLAPTPLRARAGISDLPRVEYRSLKSPQGLLDWLEFIANDGLCIVEGVPTEAGMVLKLAEYIAPAMRTIYGEVFHILGLFPSIRLFLQMF